VRALGADWPVAGARALAGHFPVAKQVRVLSALDAPFAAPWRADDGMTADA
jgi:hypothetical protein